MGGGASLPDREWGRRYPEVGATQTNPPTTIISTADPRFAIMATEVNAYDDRAYDQKMQEV